MSKFFVETSEIFEDTNKILMQDQNDVNHISKVLRYDIGDEVTLCDGEGNDFLCKIVGVNKKNIALDIIKKERSNVEPLVEVTIFQGIPKSDKLDLIIQKCTELGVRNITPVSTKFIVAKLDNSDKLDKKILRFNKIAKEAAQQSGRGVIPKVNNPVDFKAAIEKSKEYDLAIIPYEKCEVGGLKNILEGHKEAKRIAVFIGPEGGFATEEIEFAKENGVIPISLGQRILRTETAPLAIMSILMYNYDNM